MSKSSVSSFRFHSFAAHFEYSFLDMIALLNEVFMLLMLCGIEAARLWLGQEENLGKRVSVVFRILVIFSQLTGSYYSFTNCLSGTDSSFSISHCIFYILANKSDTSWCHAWHNSSSDSNCSVDMCISDLSAKQAQNLF